MDISVNELLDGLALETANAIRRTVIAETQLKSAQATNAQLEQLVAQQNQELATYRAAEHVDPDSVVDIPADEADEPTTGVIDGEHVVLDLPRKSSRRPKPAAVPEGIDD